MKNCPAVKGNKLLIHEQHTDLKIIALNEKKSRPKIV